LPFWIGTKSTILRREKMAGVLADEID